MAFDPDAYLSSNGFDPDAYLAEAAPPKAPSMVSRVADAVNGGIDSATASDSAQSLKAGVGSMYSQIGTVLDNPAAFAKAGLTAIGDTALTGYPRLLSQANKWAGGDGSLPFGIDKGAQALHEEFSPAYNQYAGELAQSRKEADSAGSKSSELRAVGNLMKQDAQAALSPEAKARDQEYTDTKGFEALGYLGKHPGKLFDMTLENLPSQVPLLAAGYGGGAVMRQIAGRAAMEAESVALKEAMMSPAMQVAQTLGSATKKAAAEEAARTVAVQAGKAAAEKVISTAQPYLTALNIGGESFTTAAQATDAIHDSVVKAKPENLQSLPMYQEYLKQTGSDKDARALLAARLSVEWAPVAGMGTAFGSLVTGGARAEAQALAGQVSGYKQAAKGVGKEMLEEAIQNPLEDLAQHTAQVQVDPTDTYDPIKSSIEGAAVSMGHSGSVQFAKPVMDSIKSGISKQPPVTPPAPPGSLTSAANIAAQQGITPASVPPEAIDAADLLGTPETADTAPPLTEAAQAPLAEPASMSILDGVTNGATSRPTSTTLDTGSATGASDNAAGSDANGVLRHDAATGAGGIGMPGTAVENDAAGGVQPNGSDQPRHVGNATNIILPDHTALPVQWEVVDADSVKASLKAGIEQPRDRESRAVSDVQINSIASNLNYDLVSRDTGVMDFGSSTLNQEGKIVGGNGRFEAISRAYDQGTAAEYRARLEADAVTKGIDPATFSGMSKPVLVRRITQPFDTRALAVASNSGGSLQYSALEQAKIDGERMNGLGDIEVNDTGDVVMSGANMTNVRRALTGYNAAELGSMTDKDGLLSQEGIRRIKNALLYKAYGNSSVLSRLVESADPDLKSVMGALVRSAGSVASVRADMKDGNKPVDADIANNLLSAVEQLAKIKSQGSSVEQHLAQDGMFGNDYSVESAMILRYLNDNIRSQKRMAGFIKQYYDGLASEDHLTDSMFATTPVTKKERLSHAISETKRANPETAGTETSRPALELGAAVGEQPANAQGDAGSSAQSQPDTGVTPQNDHQWWAALTKAEREAAIAKAGLDIKPVASLNFISKPNRAAILAAREPLLTSYTQADIAKREQVAQGTTAEDQAAVDRAVEHSRNQPLSLSAQTQERSEGRTSQAGMFTPDGRATVAAEQSDKAKADADMQAALADMGAIMRDLAGVKRVMPEDHAKLLPVLVRLFDAAFRKGYYDIREATRYVRKMLSEFAETAPYAKFLPVSLMDQAAKEAAGKMPDGFFENQGLFGQAAPKQEAKAEAEHVQDRMTNADKKRNPDNFVPPPLHTFVSAEIEKKVHDLIEKYRKAEHKTEHDPADVKVAEAAIAPVLAKAEKNLTAFSEAIMDIAKNAGIGQLIGKIKKLDKCVSKMLNPDEQRGKYFEVDLFGRVTAVHAVEQLRDTLRATIVVKSYDDVPAVMAEIKKHFELHPEQSRLKDRVSKPTAEGYRDVLMNVVLKDGLQAEIQINVPEMLAAKGVGHALYDVSDNYLLPVDIRTEASDAQVELYGAAYAASLSNSKNSDLETTWQNSGNAPTSEYASPSLPTPNALPSGNLNIGVSASDTTNKVPSGNDLGSGAAGDSFISGSSKHTIAKNASEVHNDATGSGENTTQGAQHENRSAGAGSTEGQSAATAGAAQGKRKSGTVRPDFSGRHIVRNNHPLIADSDQARVQRPGQDAAGAGGDTQRGDTAGAGDRSGGAAGLPAGQPGTGAVGVVDGRAGRAVPAGRDIPAKTGGNYHFTEADLDYKGSWITKAKQNVEAVELVKKLDKEGRKATRAEQAILAKFIGWGASEIRNNIFDKKLDEQLETLAKYDEAIASLGNKPYLTNSNYREYHPAFEVLRAKNSGLNWYSAGNITKAMLDAAKPDKSVSDWGKLRDRLRAVMSDEDWKTAERSTQYAHYTGKEVVTEILRAADRLGFKGGSMLEPGAGIGVFPGLMNSAMANNSIYTGIEFDALTGAILKHLQPDERILVESYIDSALPDNFYDVAIGNPPFSDSKVLSDPRYKKHAFALHDYFFAKTMDKVKPGGLVIFVTSRYTMDKQGDKARQYLAERADLLGAIRLPETAFKKNAGTEVVTDILFLRKKVPGETFEGHSWMGLEKIKVKGGDHLINEYFAKHPEMVLGEGAIDKNGMYAQNQYTVLPNKDVPITELLAKAVDSLPRDVFRPTEESSAKAAQVRQLDFNPKAKKEGNYYVSDEGNLMQVENRMGVPAKVKGIDGPLVRSFVRLRDALNQTQYDQLNDGDWETSLKALQKEYKAFVRVHGHLLQNTVVERKAMVEDEDGNEVEDIITSRRFKLIPKLNDDPEYSKVLALETINDDTGEIKESDFLAKRTLDQRKESKISTPHDALLSSLNDLGRVDIPLIAQRIGLSEIETINSLGTAIYETPSDGWQMADEYLSGNVKAKLKEAEATAKTDRRFARNVEALMNAQPSPVPPSDITASLGMNWIPGEVYAQFLHEKTGVKANISYNEHTGNWNVSVISGNKTNRATVDWGTIDRDAADIMEAGLTGRTIRITAKDPDTKATVFQPAATEAAIQKLKEMRHAFSDWMWQDNERTEKLVTLYNDKFNTTVSRKFDGRHLTLPGTTTTISVFDHVKRGAWRIIQSGNTYLAHAVGSGKTWEMVISAMEQKRLGMINKPLCVVPNHMLQQFSQEWLQLYPAARLMVADEKQFHTDNRRRFIARVGMSDLDGVIITHSAFKLLDLDPEFKDKMMNEQLDYYRAALEEVQDAEGDSGDAKKIRSPKVRDIQNRIEKLEEKLKATMSGEGKDKNVRFDEMGVDMLYVDEAHEYRKLEFSTVRQVKGISSTGSDRAFDLYMKTRWLEEKNPGRSLVMASGTPVTNTMAEMYSVQRFMQPKVLEEKGLQTFDAWASMFGEESTEIEADASGKYAPVTRFANIVNVPELTQMFREFADVLTSEHLAEMLGDKRPSVKYGARKLVITPQVDDYMDYKKELAARLERSRLWKPSRDEPNNPDPVIRIIGDGRLAAIDMRFIDPSLPSDPASKLNVLIDGVIKSYKKGADYTFHNKAGKEEEVNGTTQMVFSDIGFGAGVAANRGFNARAWFEKRLRDAGIPQNQVVFMSDLKKSDAKQKAFKDMNSGRVRILVGSSKNMGTGVNAQQRLRALHHLDTPWYPADLEQREGRIVRQGNKNRHVRIFAYSTKGSYDTNMWQLLARKQRFIDQALSGDSSVRRLEDISEASQFQMATAMTAGDERAIRLAGLKSDIDRYQRLYRSHEETRMRLAQEIVRAKYAIEVAERKMPDAEKMAGKVKDLSGDKFTAKAGKTTYAKRKEWGEALLANLKTYADTAKEGVEVVGEVSGMPIEIIGNIDRNNDGKVLGYYVRMEMRLGEDGVIIGRDPNDDAVGLSMRATNALAAVERKPEDLRKTITDAKSQISANESRTGAKFQFAQEMADKIKEAKELEAEMERDGKDHSNSELVQKAKAFAEKHHSEIDQRRKFTGEPYIMHPQGVVDILRTVPHTEEMLAAAWAHDTVEDTKATLDDVRAELGDKVADLVEQLTKPYDISKMTPAAQTIKLADITHNALAAKNAPADFTRRYLPKKAAELELLKGGNQELWGRAKQAIEGDDAPLASVAKRASPNPIYSQLRNVVRDLNDKIFQGSAQNVRLHLMNNLGKYGIKRDEIFWTGLEEFLSGTSKASKADVLNYLDGNGVQVEKRVLDDGDDSIPIDEWAKPRGYKRDSAGYYSAEVRNEFSKSITTRPTKHGGGNLVLPGGTNYREIILLAPQAGAWGAFDSVHFGDTKDSTGADGKTIAWLRVNDRTTADGEEALFIEEQQSKRAMVGRKKGFEGDASKQISGLNPPHSIAPMPFVSDAGSKATNAHILLSMKHSILDAIERGKSVVAWTTGTQQKDRYSLSKQIDNLSVKKDPYNPIFYIVEFTDKDGKTHNAGQKKESELEAAIGKDLARKVVEDISAGRKAEYTGMGLDIGGEWADALYGDENGLDANGKPSLMSQAVKEVARQLGIELKVERMNFYQKANADYRAKNLKTGKLLDQRFTKEQVEAADKSIYEIVYDPRELDTESDPKEFGIQPGFYITPELRSKVTSAGIPLFSQKAYSANYEVQPDTARNLPIDGSTLVELRRAAAGIESAERGITFTVNGDGKAIVTGPARVKVPTRFQQFANEHGLTLVVQRRKAFSGQGAVATTSDGHTIYTAAASSSAEKPMPLEYREAGALYFGEMGADHLDRTGLTRFSQGASKPTEGMSVGRVQRATAKLRASWHGFKHVNIVQSVKEIPNELYLRALRAAKPIAQDSEGIYDPKTKTVYLIADNIATPDRAVWVAIHEVAGHGGIRMLGAPVVESLNHAAKNGFVAKLAQAIAADRGETFDAKTHTDEAIAELAAATITGKVDAILDRYGIKVPMGMRSNLLGMIKRVVNAVRNFIGRVTGKPVEEVNDGEVLGLIRRMKDAVEGVEQGYDTAGVSNGVLASLPSAKDAFVSALGRWFSMPEKFRASGLPIIVGETPFVLKQVGAEPHPISIDRGTLIKVTRAHGDLPKGHGITKEQLEQLPDALANPLAIFESAPINGVRRKDGRVVLTAMKDGQGERVVVAIHLSKSAGRSHTINDISSVHGRGDAEIKRWVDSGLTLYFDDTRNETSPEWLTTGRLELPAVVQAAQSLSNNVRLKSEIVKDSDEPLFSSAPAQPSQEKQQPRILRMAKAASMEKDVSLVDKVMSAPFKLVGWNRIVEPALDHLLERAGEFIPEKIKAGLVSDYGLSGEYTDRKAEMKAAEAAQNRKSAGLVEMLAALTRAESRVAYQWMQEKPDTATEQALLERLPAESRETLARLKKMISDMGKEAVRLGQMSNDAYQRNNMAYLHRTYAKHVLNNEGAISKMLRARALKIKGNQYKGRGIFDEVRMDAVGAEGVFGRKLQQGQADKSLVGEKLIRFERRDDSTDAMDALPGMTKKPMGKLREVAYWPASTPVPQKFGDWVNSGTFEVRDTKGDKLVVWRDFTPDERERMGELDEVRYAVAQTLQMMTHDIEVGRFFAWTAKTYGKAKPDGRETTASESMLHSFGKDEWVQVPASNIPGTQTRKYGALAGLYIPGAVWNDIRQTAGTRIEPFGHAHEKVLQFWKKAKTAWSPAVHMNNVMANFVIADWHDLRAADLYEAVKVWAYNKRDGYREIYQRFEDSGALGGMFLSNEALRDEIAKQLESIKAELTGEQEAKNEMTRMAKVMHLVTMAGMVPKKAAGVMEDVYQFEDAIFRLAAFTKAIRYGKSDIEAGRIARHAFLNYDINAPWIQAARHTFLPFVSFFYRALPMALNTVKSKPWKVVKLMAFWHLVSMAGYMMSGGDDEDELKRKKREKEERALLPKEKQGSVWGVVPKMVRMPWNHDDDAPYFLDIRRWVPVGDVADIEMGAGMLPPWATPGGPLIMLAEMLVANKSFFTEKEIVLDTDTQGEKLEKRLDPLFKGMLPNVPLPNPLNLQTPVGEINPLGLSQGSGQSYAWSGIERSMLKKEGMIGEVRNTPAAMASAFGIKISAYPAQNMEAAKNIELNKQVREIKDTMNKINRNYNNLESSTKVEDARYERDMDRQREKLQELAESR